MKKFLIISAIILAGVVAMPQSTDDNGREVKTVDTTTKPYEFTELKEETPVPVAETPVTPAPKPVVEDKETPQTPVPEPVVPRKLPRNSVMINPPSETSEPVTITLQ